MGVPIAANDDGLTTVDVWHVPRLHDA
ncbi:hypothetical protein IL54_4277 [Sphingobium sp. ba1]|nr:hypothetical protein IL54_4277 [Sphingobium sp. ba1]